jgi:hypothetical protein
MWAEWVGKGCRGIESKGGTIATSKGPEWMGIRHHEQNIGLPSTVSKEFFSSYHKRVSAD